MKPERYSPEIEAALEKVRRLMLGKEEEGSKKEGKLVEFPPKLFSKN